MNILLIEYECILWLLTGIEALIIVICFLFAFSHDQLR